MTSDAQAAEFPNPKLKRHTPKDSVRLWIRSGGSWRFAFLTTQVHDGDRWVFFVRYAEPGDVHLRDAWFVYDPEAGSILDQADHPRPPADGAAVVEQQQVWF